MTENINLPAVLICVYFVWKEMLPGHVIPLRNWRFLSCLIAFAVEQHRRSYGRIQNQEHHSAKGLVAIWKLFLLAFSEVSLGDGIMSRKTHRFTSHHGFINFWMERLLFPNSSLLNMPHHQGLWANASFKPLLYILLRINCLTRALKKLMCSNIFNVKFECVLEHRTQTGWSYLVVCSCQYNNMRNKLERRWADQIICTQQNTTFFKKVIYWHC